MCRSGFALWASFYDYKLGQESRMAFVFLGNYVKFFTDPTALHALGNTVLFTVLSLGLGLTIGVGMSVLLKGVSARAAISCVASSRCPRSSSRRSSSA